MNSEEIKKMVNTPMFKRMMGEDAPDVDKMFKDDPNLANQMTGMWRQLTEMHDSDKKGYDEYIAK